MVTITAEGKRLQSLLGSFHQNYKWVLFTYEWEALCFTVPRKPGGEIVCRNQGAVVASCRFWMPGQDHPEGCSRWPCLQAVCSGKRPFWRPLKMIHHRRPYTGCALLLKSVNHPLKSKHVCYIVWGPGKPMEVQGVIILLKESQI